MTSLSNSRPGISFLVGLALMVVSLPAAATVPPGFTDQLIAAIPAPTSVAFTPDGRILVTTQSGALRVYCQNNTAPGCSGVAATGGLLTTAALTFPTTGGTNRLLKPAPICSNSERGLLGVAVDSTFATNRHVYVFYTRQRFDPAGINGSWEGCGSSGTGTTPVPPFNPVNRVSRFTFNAGTSIIDPATEVVLLDGMPSTAGNHNAGDLKFGNDGFLYVSIGDGGCDYAGDSGCAGSSDASRDTHTLTGKILRIGVNTNGTTFIPSTNPFVGSDADICSKGNDLADPPTMATTASGRKCRETFAWGLRNPYRFAMDPNTVPTTTRLFVNDVGQSAWEEIDIGQSGADYGWNCREGKHVNSTTGKCSPTPTAMVDPTFEYGRSSAVPGTSVSGCGSITGAAFAPTGAWPTAYDGHFFFADYNCGAIFHLTSDAGPAAALATSLGSSSATALAFDPFGSSHGLFYTTYGSSGQLRRILPPTANNSAPVAVASGTPLSGPLPLTVTFSAAGSSDADAGDTLTYFWTFGDGTPEISTAALTVQHTYTTAATFTATLVARDSLLVPSTNSATVSVLAGNAIPVATISSPAPGATFAVGDTITLTGTATDAEDGVLGPTALSWTVLLHHLGHTHPFFGPTPGNNLTFLAPTPEDLAAAASSYLEVVLTATDSQSAAGTASRNLDPRKVNLTFATNPAGLTLLVQNVAVTGPYTAVSWQNYAVAFEAPTPQTGGPTQNYSYASWSDGGARAHSVTTPANPLTLTATFTSAPSPNDGRDYTTLPPCRLLDTRDSNAPFSTGETRTLHAGPACAVPLTAKALSINVTAVAPTAAGYLSFIPTGGVGGTSTVNFRAGQTIANNAVIQTDLGCVFTVFSGVQGSGTVHLIVDVNGYFE